MLKKWVYDLKFLFLIVPMMFLGRISGGYDYEDIREITTREIVSLTTLRKFYDTHSNPYERRYIIEAIPHHLDILGIEIVPPWIIDALDSALDSPDGVLAIYAAECIGCLKLDLFTDKLAEKFASAPRTMNQHSIWFRLTVIQTLQNFDSLKVRRVLPLLLTSYSEFCILDPDFSKLLELTMHYGDKQSVKELDRFEKQAKSNIERLKKEILNERYNGKIFDQFLEAEEKIIKTKKIINAVG